MQEENNTQGPTGRRITIWSTVIFAAILALGIQYWYSFVMGGENLRDDIGLKLNAVMPFGLQSWGCSKLKQRFYYQTPPGQCTSASGIGWQ